VNMAEAAIIFGLVSSIASLTDLSAKVVYRLHVFTSKALKIPASLSFSIDLIAFTDENTSTHSDLGTNIPLSQECHGNTKDEIRSNMSAKVFPFNSASKLERALKELKSLAKKDKIRQAVEKLSASKCPG